jgi:hypothetical protein
MAKSRLRELPLLGLCADSLNLSSAVKTTHALAKTWYGCASADEKRLARRGNILNSVPTSLPQMHLAYLLENSKPSDLRHANVHLFRLR